MTRYLSIAEFWYLAEQVTGIEAPTLISASRVDLADSALHAPQAGFGDEDFYPDLRPSPEGLFPFLAFVSNGLPINPTNVMYGARTPMSARS